MLFRSADRVYKAIWGVADHALFSVTNFLVSILLARWLSPAEYGAFAIAFSVYILISTLQIGTIIEPMLIFGSGTYRSQFSGYMRTLTRAHFLITGVCSTVLLLVAAALALFGSTAVALSLAGLAAASPFMLLTGVRRRIFYVDGRIHFAAITSAVFLALSLIGAYGLLRGRALSPFNAFLAMGLGAVGACLVSMIGTWRTERSAQPTLARTLSNHWRYARWATPAIAMSWVLFNAFVIGVPLVAGVEAAAGLRAMLNLVQPPIQLLNALGTVALPSLVRAARSHRFSSLAKSSIVSFLLVAVAYAVPLAFFGREISSALYHSRYDAWTGLLGYLLPVPVICAIITASVVVLQAVEKPKAVFVSWTVGAVSALIPGVPLVFLWGARGAAPAICIGYAVAAVMFLRYAYREIPRLDAHPELVPQQVFNVVSTTDALG
jgi:O-antigen/teichoic acid export membrane protein